VVGQIERNAGWIERDNDGGVRFVIEIEGGIIEIIV